MNRSPQWHEKRREYLGASEVAAVLGLSPYTSPYEVWATKVGLLAPFEGNQATRLGQKLESVLLDEAEAELGSLLRDVEVPHETLPLRATLDGQRVVSGEVVECKTAGLLSGRTDDWGADGLVEFSDQIPQHYFVQVQAQLLCTGSELAHLYALLARRGIVTYRIEADAMFHGWLSVKVAEWWQRHIIDREPPALDGTALDVLKRLQRNDGVAMLPQDAVVWARDYQSWSEEERRCKARKEDSQRQLIEAMGLASRGVTPDGIEVSLSEVSRKGYTVEPTTYRQFRLKTKKGTDQ